MVYLVAFQNGFIWKSLFEQRRKGVPDGASISKVQDTREVADVT